MATPETTNPLTLAEVTGQPPKRPSRWPWIALSITLAVGLFAMALVLILNRPHTATTTTPTTTLLVNVVCTNGLYCINQDGQRCVFGAKDVLGAEAKYPKQSLTVAGPDGTVLAAKQLPFDGTVGRGGFGGGGFECAATVSLTVPQERLYTVDAFGLNSVSGQGPSFTVRIP